VLYVASVEAAGAALRPARGRLAAALGGGASGDVVAEGATLALAAAAANVPTLLIYTPVEVVSARAFTVAAAAAAAAAAASSSSSGGATAGAPPPLRSAALSAIRHVYATGGLAGFWAGYGASLATHAPGCAIWWSVYAMARRRLTRAPTPLADAPPPTTPTHPIPLWLAEAGAGLAAGVTSAVVTHPLDTVRTRLQSRADGAAAGGWATTARALWARAGPRGFFAGVGLRAMELGPLSAVGATLYELVKRASALPVSHKPQVEADRAAQREVVSEPNAQLSAAREAAAAAAAAGLS
jgi:hypothetical protein